MLYTVAALPVPVRIFQAAQYWRSAVRLTADRQVANRTTSCSYIINRVDVLLTGGWQNFTLDRGHITSTITTMCQDMKSGDADL